MPPLEQCFEGNFTFRVQPIVTEEPMVCGERENDLGWTSIVSAIGFFLFDCSKETVEVCEHDAVGEFGARVDGVDFATIFGDCGEGDDVIEIPSETGLGIVDVVD